VAVGRDAAQRGERHFDDETYDWLAVVKGLLASRGSALVVDEASLREANALACETTGIPSATPARPGSRG